MINLLDKCPLINKSSREKPRSSILKRDTCTIKTCELLFPILLTSCVSIGILEIKKSHTAPEFSFVNF